MRKPLISLILRDKYGELVSHIRSRKSRRIFSFIQADKSQDCVFGLHVVYEKGFDNSGIYVSKKALIYALKAFLEKD